MRRSRDRLRLLSHLDRGKESANAHAELLNYGWERAPIPPTVEAGTAFAGTARNRSKMNLGESKCVGRGGAGQSANRAVGRYIKHDRKFRATLRATIII
jgi:hypothetical protein